MAQKYKVDEYAIKYMVGATVAVAVAVEEAQK